MTRILLTAATLIGLTTAAFAQGYSQPQYPWWQSYYNQRSATYGSTYGPEATPSPYTPVPAPGD